MTKNTIWILVALMATALIGLSSYQIYWINNVIKLSREQFEKDALASMQQVAQRLERTEMITVATRSFGFFGSSTYSEENGEESYEIKIIGSNDSIENNFSYRTNDNQRVKIIVHSDSSQEIHEFISDTAGIDANIEIIAQLKSDDSEVANEVNARFNTKRKVLTKVVEEMMVQESQVPKRVHPVILDSLLQQEFRHHGILLKFDFGVYDNRAHDFRIIKTQNREQLENSSLQASLFPNDIIANNLSLIVSFPEANQYLLGKIWSSLLISLIFIVTIISVFAYVVFKIVQQKKLGELKNDFINNMTHEFKTPIATVSLATEALQEEAVQHSPLTMARYIKVIQQESKRLGAQVEKVLQLASMEKDNLRIQRKPVSLDLVLKAAIERASFQIEEGNGSLRIENLGEEISISADEAHFSNALFNLLDNAIKYSVGPPEIAIEVKKDHKHIKISVIDQGIGLSKEAQKQVFDKFYRVPTGDVHNVKGFGLGLNYVMYVVKSHNGEIKLESELGKGSTFTIILPVQ